jgi:hypothetical protein
MIARRSRLSIAARVFAGACAAWFMIAPARRVEAASDIHYAGLVIDTGGSPVSNARITLADGSLTTLSDSLGAFTLRGEVATAPLHAFPAADVRQSVRWRRGGLYIGAGAAPMRYEIFTIRGILLASGASRSDSRTVNLTDAHVGAGVFLLRVTAGGVSSVYKVTPPRLSAIAVAGSERAAVRTLGRRLVEQHELIVSAHGFMTRRCGPYESGARDIECILTPTAMPARVSAVERQEQRSVITCGADDWCTEGEHIEEQTFTVVELDNGLVSAKIFPHLGMRLLDVVDKRKGVSYFKVRDPLTAHYGNRWKTGGIDVSFPYPEHGMHFYQKSGFCIIEDPDGGAGVAMNMRFYQYQGSRERERYGRYDDRILSVIYRLRPYSTAIEATYRLDNPNPLRRGDRLWITVQMPAYEPASMRAIFPAKGIVTHNGDNYRTTSDPINDLSDWYASQAFTLDCEWPFGGVYYRADTVGRLRITNPARARGMKFVAGGRLTQDPAYMEFWTGNGTWFEDPGAFAGAFEPVSFTHYYWNTYGIGMPSYADSLFAVALDEDSFAVVAPKKGHFKVTDFSGAILAEGVAGPYTVLTGESTGHNLVFFLDGEEIFRSAFPLPISDNQDRVAAYKARQAGGAEANERSVVPFHSGPPQLKACDSPNNCYRLGHLDKVSGDYLEALAAWERGEEVAWGDSPVDAYFFRALQAVAHGNPSHAVELLDTLIAQRPNAYWARLVHAYLSGDLRAARELSRQNPALPEALLVCELLGDSEAAERRVALERDGGAAGAMVEQFRLLLTEGRWTHIPRYGPLCDGECP